MNRIFGIGVLLSVIQLTFCSYGPWKDIKQIYEDIAYDKEGAEIRQAELEKNCLELTNGEENVCYEDCILRQHYGMLSLIQGVSLGSARFELEAKLEKTVLMLVDDRMSIWDNPIRKSVRHVLDLCAEELPAIELDNSVREKFISSLEETEKIICVKYLTGEEKAELSKTLDCVKEKIKHFIQY